MIIVEKNNGDVIFLNEREFINIAYSKDEKLIVAYPTQPTAHIGMPRREIEVKDVQSVTYTNEIQPENRTYRTYDILDFARAPQAVPQNEQPNGVPEWYDDAKWYPLLDQSVGNIGLMNRTRILLEKNGVYKVRDLCCLNKTDLLKFRNFGKKSLNDCDDFLEAKGIGFGNDVELIEKYHQILMKQ